MSKTFIILLLFFFILSYLWASLGTVPMLCPRFGWKKGKKQNSNFLTSCATAFIQWGVLPGESDKLSGWLNGVWRRSSCWRCAAAAAGLLHFNAILTGRMESLFVYVQRLDREHMETLPGRSSVTWALFMLCSRWSSSERLLRRCTGDAEQNEKATAAAAPCDSICRPCLCWLRGWMSLRLSRREDCSCLCPVTSTRPFKTHFCACFGLVRSEEKWLLLESAQCAHAALSLVNERNPSA